MTKRYTPDELAKRWGVSVNTLRNWRHLDKGPDFHKSLGRVYYDDADVREYERVARIEVQHD